MGSGEWGVGSGEWGVGNGEWGVGSGEWGVGSGNGEWGMGNGVIGVIGGKKYYILPIPLPPHLPTPHSLLPPPYSKDGKHHSDVTVHPNSSGY
ncbi:MAG: hypothetical protein DSM106950_14625 [Stigonema ocellatum SAG 48.90 = DSM 106950]|nr:hypothetical protein [Stigonema ocellatum SAG 48.90 = DSM 106950]